MFCFIFTEITSVLDIFMDWFFMSLQNSLCCSFIFTQITWIYSTFAWTDSIWVFRCPCFTIMSKKTPRVWAVPVSWGEMVHQIRPGNQSAFAFMTINNSTTPLHVQHHISAHIITTTVLVLLLNISVINVIKFLWRQYNLNFMWERFQ